MRSSLIILLAATFFGALPLAGASSAGPRTTTPFDDGWRFTVGDPANAQASDFDDHAWRMVNVPHDWSIAGPFDQNNPAGPAGAFLPSGVAWYRKSFPLPAADKGRRFFVEFDGIVQNSDVWINGAHLGHRPNGYVSLRYELTDHLKFGPGEINVIAVRADTAQQPASRWYAGAGINRHVRLVAVDPVHLEGGSTFVSSTKIVVPSGARDAKQFAQVRAVTRVVNQSTTTRKVAVEFALVDPAGTTVATATDDLKLVPAGSSVPFTSVFELNNPQLWDLHTPQLYTARVTVREGEKPLDDEAVAFGIRDAQFDSARGFLLNGNVVRIYGVCLHEDGGAFGAAVPLAVWEQRLATLRTLGVNAVRTAHNPPNPGFLDLCDRMGFLVMDELFDCWTVGKNPYDYHLYFEQWSKTDVRDTVLRDRNHPSIILYSAGNEIHDTPKEELARNILGGLVAVFHEYDPTRPVTQALFRPNVSHDYTNGLADLLDVIGTNYRDKELLAAWADKPGRKIIGTEQRHDRETWLALRDHPQEAGQFLWTGVDYLGEARAWPDIAASFGLLDRAGYVKPLGRERQSWWTPQPMVAIARRVAPNQVSAYDPGYEPANASTRRGPVIYADWTPGVSAPHTENVEVTSNCETVELFLNGKSLGAKPINADAAPRTWSVPFEAGTLRAVGRNGGKDVAADELRTAGKPAAIALAADRNSVSADWEDVVRVTATVVDAAGVPVPNAASLVSFTIEGPAAVVAVDNADNASHESFQATQRHAFQGRCFAWVRATGQNATVTVRASSDGLNDGAITLHTAAKK